MGERNLKFFIVGLLIILFAGLVSADYTFGTPTHNIRTTYTIGEKVSGSISIKLTNESNFTLFEDSEGNSMTLLELITEDLSFLYTVNAIYGTLDTSTLQNLKLDDGVFNLPNTAGIISYQFNFSDEEVFTEQIEMALATDDLNATLNSKIAKLNALKGKITSYNLFEQTSINSALNMDEMESKLANLGLDYIIADTQTKLNDVSVKLALINIPDNIAVTQTAHSIPTFSKSGNINLDVLEAVTNSTYETGEENKYKTAIVGWHVSNLDVKISFNEFSAYYGSTQEFVVGIFDLEISKINALDYSSYIFIEKINSTLFKEDYQEQEQGNYYVFDFAGDTEIISFSTIANVDFTNLPFFISPAMTELGLEDFEYVEGEEDEKDLNLKKKWTIFVLVIIFILIIGFMLYLVLQTWYKKRYEAYLFRNRNDLYNLANYITNSKKRGLDNSQIETNLKKSKWSAEQIRYALRKYSGKRTGMYEIPLKRVIKKKEQRGQRYRYGGYPPK